MNEELVKRLRRYTMGCVAYKLDSDFAAAVQEAADVIEKMGELEHGGKMASWVNLLGEEFRHGICANDEMYCSSCHYCIHPRIQTFIKDGVKYGRGITPDYCPNCGADMRGGKDV